MTDSAHSFNLSRHFVYLEQQRAACRSLLERPGRYQVKEHGRSHHD